jgi:hypothetical protein
VRTLAIITGKCILSAKALAEGINKRSHGEWQARVYDIRKREYPDYPSFLFAYGCSNKTPYRKDIVNSPHAVKRCVDKIKTFETLHAAGVRVCMWATDKELASKLFERIVVRSKVDGRKAEDLDYFFQGDKLPDAPLYTEYFEHKYEYRIIVFMGKVVGRYYKAETPDDKGVLEWSFNVQPKRGFEKMDEACLKAAKALGIDYVGFDVVAMNKNDFVILEANSGPILTGEAEEAIINYYLNLPE